MNADGTMTLAEMRAFYIGLGRSTDEADRIYLRIHGHLPGGWWLRPHDPSRSSPRAWLIPKRPPPCRRLVSSPGGTSP